MARETITRYTSDLSGEEIPDGRGMTVTIKPEDPNRKWYELDVSEDEINEWIGKAREVPRRGRQPK